MRKVLFKKWIPAEWIVKDNPGVKELIPGARMWEEDFTHEGLFHQWGSAYVEFEIGPGNYSVALVEISDGTIVEVLPSSIKFIE